MEGYFDPSKMKPPRLPGKITKMICKSYLNQSQIFRITKWKKINIITIEECN